MASTLPDGSLAPNRTRERVLGLVLVLVGLVMMRMSWFQAATEDLISGSLATAGPVAAVLGGALLAFPGPRAERLARGLPAEAGPGDPGLTQRWKATLAIALLAGIVHVVLVANGVFG